MTTVTQTIPHNAAKTLADYFAPLELANATTLTLTNNNLLLDGGALYYTLDGTLPDEDSPFTLEPEAELTLADNGDIKALRFIGDDLEDIAVSLTMTVASVITSQYALGITLESLTNLQLMALPITVRESLPLEFAAYAPLVYGGQVGQGFPKTTWVLDITAEQYTQLHALLGNYQSSECYIVTSLPHARTTFALYRAFMNWPTNPNQFYNNVTGWYLGLPLEFWRMEAVV